MSFRKLMTLAALATLMAGPALTAKALTIEVLIDAPTMNATINDSDNDPRSIGVDSSYTLYLFESETSDGANLGEAILRLEDGETTPALYVEESDMLAAINAIATTSTTSISDFDDMVAKADGTLYAILRDNANSREHIIRIPYAASTTSTLEVMALDGNGVPADPNDGGSQGSAMLDYDALNDRLVIYRDDAFDSGITEGLYTIDATATLGSLSLLADKTTLDSALTSPTLGGDPSDLVVGDDGTIYLIWGFGSGENDGDITTVTPNGASSSLLVAGADLNAVDGGSGISDSVIEITSTGYLVVYNEIADGDYTRISPDGSTLAKILTEADYTASVGTFPGFNGNGFAIDNLDRVYTTSTSPSGSEAYVRLSGDEVPVELSGFSTE